MALILALYFQLLLVVIEKQFACVQGHCYHKKLIHLCQSNGNNFEVDPSGIIIYAFTIFF